MALNLRMVLEMESAAAKAELSSAAAGVQKLGAATERAATSARTGAIAAKAEAAARQQAAAANRAYTATAGQAAGATGNLVSQFNDIGMILAAGQNPLQLAIQQGTQITQVIGPMGAAGAAKALGGAFIGMLNPLSLVTLGVIAASGYMIQWLTAADDDAAALTAEFERQKAALESIVAETEKLRLARGMMLSGAQSEDEQVVLEELNRLTAEREAIQGRLNALQDVGSRAAGFAEQATAARDALSAELATIDAKIAALNAQRELNAETAGTLDLSGKVRTAAAGIASALQAADGSRLVASFQAAFPVATQLLGLAQGIVSTINEASARADKIAGIAGQQTRMLDDERGGQGDQRRSAAVYNSSVIMKRFNPVAAGAGGGGGAARDEANALEELIRTLEGEIEALRVADPIQEEMIKHREALTGATEAERQKVEELIATREREALLMEGAKARAAFFEDIGTNALDALINKGESFNDVLKNIASSLIQAAIQAAIFGSGPFGSMFGGKSILSGLFGGGGGGGLGGLFGGGKAEGGMVYGPGTGTSDSVLMALSNGEMVINAKATSRNRALLEAINNGSSLPGLATGGMVGGDTRRAAARGGRELPASIYIDARGSRGDREIEEVVRKGATQVVSLYDREGLAVSVQRVSRDPKRRG